MSDYLVTYLCAESTAYSKDQEEETEAFHFFWCRQLRWENIFTLLYSCHWSMQWYTFTCSQLMLNAQIHQFWFIQKSALSWRSSFCVNCKASLLCFLGFFLRCFSILEDGASGSEVVGPLPTKPPPPPNHHGVLYQGFGRLMKANLPLRFWHVVGN